mmetsp:Transcript_11074/g.37699  ORF Transcript_11074/g.37699 Transcript_11074/m.37699 type:complete len:298 (+) Transcript_11074:49-942(+)
METVDLKLVLLGNPGVGKTALVYRYLYNNFGDTESTIGASFALKKVDAGKGPCNVGIWDTAGQERFDSLSSFYCRGARAAVIAYDVTDRASWDACVGKWALKAKAEAEPGCRLYLVGTKADLLAGGVAARAVSEEEVAAFAARHGASAMLTSAKEGAGIAAVFHQAVADHERAREKGGGVGTIGARGSGEDGDEIWGESLRCAPRRTPRRPLRPTPGARQGGRPDLCVLRVTRQGAMATARCRRRTGGGGAARANRILRRNRPRPADGSSTAWHHGSNRDACGSEVRSTARPGGELG